MPNDLYIILEKDETQLTKLLHFKHPSLKFYTFTKVLNNYLPHSNLLLYYSNIISTSSEKIKTDRSNRRDNFDKFSKEVENSPHYLPPYLYSFNVFQQKKDKIFFSYAEI